MPSKASRKRSGRPRSIRRMKQSSRRSGRKVRSATRRRAMQRGSGVFDSIFSSKWLSWLDKKKDPEEEKKNSSDLATFNETEMDKIDAELASLKSKYPEIQDKKPNKMPPVLSEGVPVLEQVGKGRRNYHSRRKSNRSRSSRNRRF